MHWMRSRNNCCSVLPKEDKAELRMLRMLPGETGESGALWCIELITDDKYTDEPELDWYERELIEN